MTRVLQERNGLTSLSLPSNARSATDSDSRRNRSAFRIWDKNISEVANLDIDELRDWLEQVEAHLPSMKAKVAHEIIKELRSRVNFLLDVGLNYLSLNRQSASLSGGESQRIRLATQIGSQLVNVLYILDEPSIGLHQRDNERLINSLKELARPGQYRHRSRT